MKLNYYFVRKQRFCGNDRERVSVYRASGPHDAMQMWVDEHVDKCEGRSIKRIPEYLDKYLRAVPATFEQVCQHTRREIAK